MTTAETEATRAYNRAYRKDASRHQCFIHADRKAVKRSLDQWLCQDCIDFEARQANYGVQYEIALQKRHFKASQPEPEPAEFQDWVYYRPKMGDSLAYLDTILARIAAEDAAKPQLEMVME